MNETVDELAIFVASQLGGSASDALIEHTQHELSRDGGPQDPKAPRTVGIGEFAALAALIIQCTQLALQLRDSRLSKALFEKELEKRVSPPPGVSGRQLREVSACLSKKLFD